MSFFDFLKPVASFLGGPVGGPLLNFGLNALGGSQQNAANMASAQQQQQFQAQQAQISRDWQEGQNQLDRRFNRSEANRLRAWSGRQGGVSRRFNSRQAARTRSFNSRESRVARGFYARMSNTAHQRQMSDMRRAGLNPILAAKHGGSASALGAAASAGAASSGIASGTAASSKGGGAPGAGSGSMAQLQNVLGPASTSALAYRSNEATVKSLRQQTETGAASEAQIRAQAALTKAQTATERTRAAQIRSDTALKAAQTLSEGVRPAQIRQGTLESRARTKTYPAQIRASEAHTARGYAEAGRAVAETGAARERELKTWAERQIVESGFNKAEVEAAIYRLMLEDTSGQKFQQFMRTYGDGVKSATDIMGKLKRFGPR